MGWSLLSVRREEWMGNNRWGRMFLRALPTGWEFLCYSYELPWLHDAAGRSLSNVSRIRAGFYELQVRTDGQKGWRLELQGTGHRTNIQVHRAAPNLFIQGCILPIHFRSQNPRVAPPTSPQNQVESVKLMAKIKERYDFLVEVEVGNPNIQISGTLPASARVGIPV